MPLIHSEPDALARIYSSALLDMAKPDGQGQIENVLGELEDILEMARADRSFSEFLASRILPAAKREQSLKSILGGRVSDLTLRFLLVLNEKDRLSHLPAIVGAYQQAVQESYGRVEVDVYTA
ncbi:MAG: F0F1 ATP synthase subunit delta, partial [Phycisphaerales bacterium]|nr:F0F1 ATP synthase subunit delta [Phycisphaerales bacterium]